MKPRCSLISVSYEQQDRSDGINSTFLHTNNNLDDHVLSIVIKRSWLKVNWSKLAKKLFSILPRSQRF